MVLPWTPPGGQSAWMKAFLAPVETDWRYTGLLRTDIILGSARRAGNGTPVLAA